MLEGRLSFRSPDYAGLTVNCNNRRNAYTLVELVVALGIIAILAGLLLPAVQYSREAARSVSCRNNSRQSVLSAHLFEVNNGHLPSNEVVGHPELSPSTYSADIGALSQLLPYLEESGIADGWDTTTFSFSSGNGQLAAKPLAVFKCPSCPWSSLFPKVSTKINGTDSSFVAHASDYVVNSGVIRYLNGTPRVHNAGSFRTIQRDDTFERGTRFSEIRDGLSNTLLIWESAGGRKAIRQGGQIVSTTWYEAFSPGYAIGPISSGGDFVSINLLTAPTFVAYTQSWAGFRPGTLPHRVGSEGNARSPVNYTNDLGQPFSFHPQHANCGMADGSVRTISSSVDPQVLYAMATGNGLD